MTDNNVKFEEISKEMAALQAAGNLSETDQKKVGFWNDLKSNARDILEPTFGWEAEPEPVGWKAKLLESIGDAGIAMAGGYIPPRFVREIARQDVKGEAIKAFEEAVSTGNYSRTPANASLKAKAKQLAM